MKDTQEFLSILAADNAAIVRLLDGAKDLPPTEDLRVFVIDKHNFSPSLEAALLQAGVSVVPSEDDARRLFLLHRDDARQLLSRVVTEKPIPAEFIESSGKSMLAGVLRVVMFLGSRAMHLDAPLNKVRKAALTSPIHLAVLKAVHAARN